MASSKVSSLPIGPRSILARMKTPTSLFALLLVGCAGSATTTTTTTTTSAPVIAALKTHDGKVSIVGGGSALRVSVTKDDGTVVATGATLDELRARDPETWMLVTSSVAANGAYLDATFTETPAPTLK